MVDIDGTICNNTLGDYESAQPFPERIEYFNQLFEQGHEIHYWTARGGNSGRDWTELTLKQLNQWGAKYTTAKTGKPAYDLFICDKAINVEEYFK